MCEPMGAVADEYMASSDTEKMKRMVCADQQSFHCLFGAGIEACQSLLSQGKDMGIELPTSNTSLTEQCETLGSVNATDAPTDAPISQAAGSGALARVGVCMAVALASMFSCPRT